MVYLLFNKLTVYECNFYYSMLEVNIITIPKNHQKFIKKIIKTVYYLNELFIIKGRNYINNKLLKWNQSFSNFTALK